MRLTDARAARAHARFIFTYGMIIYKNLGPEAQNSFSQTWGVSYALDNCSEWQDVAIEACKVALILVVLDLLRFTKDRPWFEEHGAPALLTPWQRAAALPDSARPSQSTSSPFRPCCSTAPRATGGSRRACWSASRRA